MSAVFDVIKARKSIRKYLPAPVEEEKLQQVLNAGRIAPTAGNAQRWKFIVVRDREVIQKLVNACGGQTFVGEAPIFLAACADGLDRPMNCGQLARTIDCSIAMSFMILVASELGLGTCWIGNFSNDKVKKLLKIPDDSNVIAVSPLGYPNETPIPKPRRQFDEVVSYESW